MRAADKRALGQLIGELAFVDPEWQYFDGLLMWLGDGPWRFEAHREAARILDDWVCRKANDHMTYYRVRQLLARVQRGELVA